MPELLEYVDIPVPWRGLDTDSSPLLISDEHATVLDNFIPGVPGQLPARRGFTDLGILRPNTGTQYNNMITSMIPTDRYGKYVLIGEIGDVGTPTQWPSTYVSLYQSENVSVPGYTPNNSTRYLVYYDVLSSIAAGPITTITNDVLPSTQHTAYEGCMFWTSAFSITYPTKQSASTSSGRRLIKWTGVKPDTASHTNTATVNNGSTTVTLVTAPTGRDLTGMIMRFNTAPAATGYHYGYEVISHTTGSTTVTLAEPYGLGESTTNVPNVTVAAAVTFLPIDVVYNSPLGSTCAINHLERIFVGRPDVKVAVGSIQPRRYYNAIQWSEPGQPEKWPDTNILVVGGDVNDRLMGFGSVGRTLIVFGREQTYAIMGDSESTFSVSRLTTNIGCCDSLSIVNWGNNLIWASREGIHMMTPDLQITTLTRHESRLKGGISEMYTNITKRTPPSGFTDVHLSVHCHVTGDYLFAVVNPDYTTDAVGLVVSFICHIPTRSWSIMNPTDRASTLKYIAQRQAPTRAKKIMAAVRNGYVGLVDVLEGYQGGTLSYYSPVYQDTVRDNGVATVFPVALSWKSGWKRLVTGDSYTVRRVYVEHGWVYSSATTLTNGPSMSVALQSDSSSTGTVGTFVPRRLLSFSTSVRSYTDEMRSDQFPSKTAAVRFEMSGNNTSAFNSVNQTMDMRIHRVRMVIEPQRQGYNQVKVT